MTEKKKPFRTILDPPKVTVTPSGEKEEEIIELILDEKGNETFKVTGKTNIYEKIQAHLEDTKIENILARCIDTGDYSILDRVQGSYMDTTEMPENLIEAKRKIVEAENNFMNLPLEIRSKYENNFNKYLADFGTEEWMKNMGFVKEEPKKEEKEAEKTVKEKKQDE